MPRNFYFIIKLKLTKTKNNQNDKLTDIFCFTNNNVQKLMYWVEQWEHNNFKMTQKENFQYFKAEYYTNT